MFSLIFSQHMPNCRKIGHRVDLQVKKYEALKPIANAFKALRISLVLIYAIDQLKAENEMMFFKIYF